MPMEREKYPADWEKLARAVKEETGWKCEECGKQCRKPGEKFDTHKRTLTVAHLNHKPWDCRRENLKALCAPCHLRYDAKHHAETRRKNRERRKTVELNITQEHVDEIMEKVIAEKVMAVMENDWYGTVKNRIREKVEHAVKSELAERFNDMVVDIVNEFMEGTPVEVNDGWGNRRRYESYTDFFAAELQKQVGNSYDIKREVERSVKAKTEEIWKSYKREITEAVIAKHAEDAGAHE